VTVCPRLDPGDLEEHVHRLHVECLSNAGVEIVVLRLVQNDGQFQPPEVRPGVILVFVGGKMTLVDIAPIPIALRLTIIATILVLSVGWSLWKPALAQSMLPDARQRI